MEALQRAMMMVSQFLEALAQEEYEDLQLVADVKTAAEGSQNAEDR